MSLVADSPRFSRSTRSSQLAESRYASLPHCCATCAQRSSVSRNVSFKWFRISRRCVPIPFGSDFSGGESVEHAVHRGIRDKAPPFRSWMFASSELAFLKRSLNWAPPLSFGRLLPPRLEGAFVATCNEAALLARITPSPLRYRQGKRRRPEAVTKPD